MTYANGPCECNCVFCLQVRKLFWMFDGDLMSWPFDFIFAAAAASCVRVQHVKKVWRRRQLLWLLLTLLPESGSLGTRFLWFHIVCSPNKKTKIAKTLEWMIECARARCYASFTQCSTISLPPTCSTVFAFAFAAFFSLPLFEFEYHFRTHLENHFKMYMQNGWLNPNRKMNARNEYFIRFD